MPAPVQERRFYGSCTSGIGGGSGTRGGNQAGKTGNIGDCQWKPVIGLPGYPVSAYINFENFVIPVLQKLAGRTETGGTTVRAVISKRLVS